MWTAALSVLFSAALAAPAGYVQAASAEGVVLWRQDVSGGEPDFVVEVDLDRARLEHLVDPDGGNLRRKTVPQWWDQRAHGDQFALVNAAFFSTNSDPTPPAFGLRHPEYVHQGYGTYAEYVGEQLTIHWTDDRVSLYGANPADITDGSKPPNQVVALSPFANKSATSWVPRTFLGVRDADARGNRTVLIFASRLATQAYARDELARFGASSTIMLDGGGSTQLRVQGTDYISSSRTVPHVLRVLAGRPAPTPRFRGEVAGESTGGATVELAAGEERTFWVELRNTGAEAWVPGVTRLAPLPRDHESPHRGAGWPSPGRAATVPAVTNPGEIARFSYTLRGAVEGEHALGFGWVQDGVTWFADGPNGGGPSDGTYTVRFRVLPPEDTGDPEDTADPVDTGAPGDSAPEDTGDDTAGPDDTADPIESGSDSELGETGDLPELPPAIGCRCEAVSPVWGRGAAWGIPLFAAVLWGRRARPVGPPGSDRRRA